MTTTQTEDRLKCALFWWGMAVIAGLTVAIVIQVVGLGALPGLVLGLATTVAMGAFATRVWCRSADEIAADAAAAEKAAARALAERAAAAEQMAAPRAAPAPRPLPRKAAPTVPSAPAPAPRPAAAPAPVAEALAPAPTPAAAPAPAAESAAPAAESAGATRPAGIAAPRDGQADDLKQIKGIGKKAEAQLNALGIHHFDQIAGWTAAEVAWIDENLDGFKGRATRDDWVAQAAAHTKG